MDSCEPPELTERNLAEFLAARGIVADEGAARVRLLTGGVSNLAFWVDHGGGACVVKQARARLAVEMEWLADVRRIEREAEAMEWLHERLGPPRIPRMIFLDRAAKVMVMEAIAPPAENYKSMLLRGEVEPGLAGQFGTLLAEIHNATLDGATRERFGETAFFEQLRLSPYYDTAAARHPSVAGRIAELRRECLGEGFCLVHGDYSPKNVLIRNGGLVLLDYEVAHWGNPSFDLGFALTHFLCKAIHLPPHGPSFLAAARRFWSCYQDLIALPEVSRRNAGYHLAAIMLARVDGKSPLEYLTEEAQRERVRAVATVALGEPDTSVDSVMRAVERESP
jgi:aminoglycoside phosphotransferase (APT) family kinase protein